MQWVKQASPTGQIPGATCQGYRPLIGIAFTVWNTPTPLCHHEAIKGVYAKLNDWAEATYVEGNVEQIEEQIGNRTPNGKVKHGQTDAR